MNRQVQPWMTAWICCLVVSNLIYLCDSFILSHKINNRCLISIQMSSSTNPSQSSTNNKPSPSTLWTDAVQYIDLNSMDLSSSSTSRKLPLFLLGGAFYPKGITFLHVYEMKYRTMMFDIAKSDNLFGYIHTDSKTGQIAKVGTLCKITSSELLEDGRQYIELEGMGRFTVRKILKTLPYILAEVDADLMDEIPYDIPAVINLELSVYDALKYYLRLMKCYSVNSDMVISQAAKKSRPTKANALDHSRRTDFSFALANMIQIIHDKESQRLLQTTDVVKRLEAEREILAESAVLLSEKLIQMDLLTADKRDTIKMQTYTQENDEDILPPDIIEQEAVVEKDEWDISNVM